MEKTEETNKYQNGKIYKIISQQTDIVYVGSTCEAYLSNRLARHKSDYKGFKRNDKQYRYITSFEIIKFPDVQILLLENYPCESKKELHTRERYYIELLDCVNKVLPTRSIQEYRRKYYDSNKDELKTKQNDYYLSNKEKVKQSVKLFREKNYDQLNEKLDCDVCGGKYTKKHKSEHLRTKKHLMKLEI